MDNKQLINKFKTLPWRVWLMRRFPIMVAYLMIKNSTKEAFARQGIIGEFPLVLFENNTWYGCDEMFETAEKSADKYLKTKGINYLVKICLNGYRRALRAVAKMVNDKNQSPLKQFHKVVELLDPVNVSIWTAHASEVYYNKKIRRLLGDTVSEDKMETFIGDLGQPKRKNAHALMIEDAINGASVRELREKYGWFKTRTAAGFEDGYTIEEMKKLRAEILKNPPLAHVYPPIPGRLKKIVGELQSLVYLRTLRTDALFEIYFRARPIFNRVAKLLGIDSVAYYLPQDLLRGRPIRYVDRFTILKYHEQILVTTKSIIAKSTGAFRDEVKGVAAFIGKVTGQVKIVFHPSEINKVKIGDILVTNMTIPAYLSGMKRAVAFVTDEGGITCHAAILARELKKPCVIGTKFATRVFHDGQLVEVDATNGIVKIVH